MSSREQFEAHFPLPEHVRWDGEQYLCDSRYQIRAFLTYCDQWDAWQASRQTLVVELPQQSGVNRDWNQAIRYCHQAIEAAGINVRHSN